MGVGRGWNPCFPVGQSSLQLLYYLVWGYVLLAKRLMPFSLYLTVGSVGCKYFNQNLSTRELGCPLWTEWGLVHKQGSREGHQSQQGAHSLPRLGHTDPSSFNGLTLISSLGLAHRRGHQVTKWNHYFFRFSSSEMKLKHMESDNFLNFLTEVWVVDRDSEFWSMPTHHM